MINPSIIAARADEQIALALRELYGRYGYTHYRMSKFEEYELYVQNKDFIGSGGIISFTDTDGKLMALKPDVTLSIIKNLRRSKGVQKVYYNENVYRVSKGSGVYREILQTGLECIGEIGRYEICEVLFLALKSLETVGRPFRLDLSHMELLTGLIASASIPEDSMAELVTCIKRKNADGIRELFASCGADPAKGETLAAVAGLYGSPAKVIPALRAPLPQETLPYVEELNEICTVLQTMGYGDAVGIDLSAVNDMSYYNGIVCRGYLDGIPDGVLSGGCYDRMMKKMGRDCGAIGFAVSLDRLDLLHTTSRAVDCDLLLLYGENVAPITVLNTVNKLTAEGQSVLTAKKCPEGIRAGRIAYLAEDGTMTEGEGFSC